MSSKRLIATLILVFSISLCFLISPALSQSKTVDAIKKAPVMLDGKVLFQVSGSDNFTPTQRAEIVNSLLKKKAEFQEPIRVKINRDKQQITIRVAPADDIDNDIHLVTVTKTDVMLGMTVEDRAKSWQEILQNAIDNAQKERTNAYILRAIIISLLLTAGAIALSFQFQWINRRFSPRRGRNMPPTKPTWQQFLPLTLTCLEAVMWAAVIFYIAELFPLIRTWRYQFLQVLTASFTTPLFRLGSKDCSLLELLLLLLLIIGIWLLVKGFTSLLKYRVISPAISNRNLQDTMAFLTQYALTFIGLLIIFQGWGIDISSLAILASALGVGIGFGLQNITNNFIGGLIITFERPIRVGDFVKVGDTVGVVEGIGLRSTKISTLDQVSLIVPNSRFLESAVLNWSYGNPVSRIRVPIGVAYGSNISLLQKVILEIAKNHSDVLPHPGPQLWFQEFGDSSLNFDLFVWINEPRKQFKLISELNYSIEAALRKNENEIPFPQRDLNLRSPQLEEAIALWIKLNGLPKEKEPFYPEVVQQKQSENIVVPTPNNDETSTREPTASIEERSSIEDIDLDALVAQMRGEDGVEIKDRRYGFNLYPKCFVGSDAVQWLMRTQKSGIKAAIAIGQLLIERGIIHHVLDEHDFKNENLFYRFYIDDE